MCCQPVFLRFDVLLGLPQVPILRIFVRFSSYDFIKTSGLNNGSDIRFIMMAFRIFPESNASFARQLFSTHIWIYIREFKKSHLNLDVLGNMHLIPGSCFLWGRDRRRQSPFLWAGYGVDPEQVIGNCFWKSRDRWRVFWKSRQKTHRSGFYSMCFFDVHEKHMVCHGRTSEWFPRGSVHDKLIRINTSITGVFQSVANEASKNICVCAFVGLLFCLNFLWVLNSWKDQEHGHVSLVT